MATSVEHEIVITRLFEAPRDVVDKLDAYLAKVRAGDRA
jgi:hypothetical protein